MNNQIVRLISRIREGIEYAISQKEMELKTIQDLGLSNDTFRYESRERRGLERALEIVNNIYSNKNWK